MDRPDASVGGSDTATGSSSHRWDVRLRGWAGQFARGIGGIVGWSGQALPEQSASQEAEHEAARQLELLEEKERRHAEEVARQQQLLEHQRKCDEEEARRKSEAETRARQRGWCEKLGEFKPLLEQRKREEAARRKAEADERRQLIEKRKKEEEDARRTAEAEARRQLLEQQRSQEETRRKAAAEERERQRVQSVLRSGQHEGRFYALSGDPIDCVVRVKPHVKPTVRCWKKVLAQEHFLCPSFRWIILWEDDDALADDAVLMFCDQTDSEARVINAVQKVVPELINVHWTMTQQELQSHSREVILRAVEEAPRSFKYLPERFRADIEIAEVAVDGTSGYSISDVAGSLRSDRKLFMMSLKNGCRQALRIMPPEFLDDAEILELAKKTRGSDSLLEYLPPRFRADKETILCAIGDRGWGCVRDWELVDKNLQRSRSFVLTAVARNPEIFQFCIDDFRSDRKIVEAALQSTTMSIFTFNDDIRQPVLQWASEELQNDRELVLAQVRQAGRYLVEHAHPKWLEDAEVMKTAIRTAPAIVSSFCADRGMILENPAFILDLLKEHGFSKWETLVRSENLQRDRDFALKAIREVGRISVVGVLGWPFTPRWWFEDEEILRVALGRHGKDLQYVSETFRKREDIVGIAVNQDGIALQFAAENLRDNRDLVLQAVRNDGKALEFASPHLRADREVVGISVRQTAEAFHFVDEKLRLEDGRIKEMARVAARGNRDQHPFPTLFSYI